LRRGAGSELDPRCVDALIAAREKGHILVQGERGQDAESRKRGSPRKPRT
jgi:HD-GYP domain-containing protein (c-di-GMP phosphodiesterase class II)